MQQANRSSWRFAHGVEQLPHALVYIRDALRLQVESGLGVPPPLSEMPPDRSGLLDSQAHGAAGGEWATWWATLLKFEAGRHFVGGEDFRKRILEYDQAVDPETAPALAGTGLQAAARALAGEARPGPAGSRQMWKALRTSLAGHLPG